MPQEKTIQTEIGGFVSTLMREHFGKGPTSIFVSIIYPFIAIHLRGCLTATEKILLKRNEVNHVYKISDLIMEEMIAEIKLVLSELAECDVKEVYADWNLIHESGMIIVVLNEEANPESFARPANFDEKAFQEELNKASVKAQREPGSTEVYWLNDRTFLVLEPEKKIETPAKHGRRFVLSRPFNQWPEMQLKAVPQNPKAVQQIPDTN
ncbi:DUF2294 domain-containing protein [Planomicrobium sp. CPCC 101110]|uniref:DUF2294 domain-containing protein n=1 Tax=Planomicrobium sp. CPCC 101110 TaxID=2599619 RepID=UPI0011B43BCA|nr:Na-translocating system protein MpsC family protein [Planomicrobium sp. CPCC 101110]TWT27419.1 DUF2294 family protein [Planomicrobium sp. CPCC 101110]